jgi:hypothetical protein
MPTLVDVEEEVLAGGVANPGVVVRVGDTVRRPRKPQSTSVHAFLRHLVDDGLEGRVPTPLGFDDRDREVLSYIEGHIHLPPEAAWSAGDDLLVSVAQLQRRVLDAAFGYAAPDDAVWDDAIGKGYYPAGVEGPVVCHNDLCVENVVTRDGRAVGFIDFDYARPVDPLFDIAVAVRHWAPVRAPVDLAAVEVDVDVAARFRAFTDEHGLDRRARERVVGLIGVFLHRAHDNVQRLAAAGVGGFAEMVADGYVDQNRRSAEWLRTNAATLAG